MGVKKYHKPIIGAIGITFSILLIIMLSSTPIYLLLKISDPYHGVIHSTKVGRIPAKLVLSPPGLKGSVKILFDEHGVPQIYAENEEAASFAVGFVHAWYRLWEMDIQRRLASGELSEILGRSTLRSDINMRILGLRRSAEATVEWIKTYEPEVYKLLEAYSEGVNYAIKRMEESNSLPLMFKLLDYKPKPWSPVDSIVWAKYMAWGLTNFFDPVKLSYLVVKLGYEDVNTLWPIHPYYQDNITVIPGDGEINGKRISVDPYKLRSLNWFEEWATGLNFNNPDFKLKVEKASLDILEKFGERPREIGSNDWAVSPSRSVSGYAMMADDPHLSLNMPSLWYFLRIKAGNSLDVFGATLAGIPFILIGHNKYISWGLTNTEIGVMDFYVEKVDPHDPTKYFYNGKWIKMNHIVEIIKVKGEEPLPLKVNITIHGPVITTKGLVISFKWTGNAGFDNSNSGVTREAIALYKINKAKNLKEFMNALAYWDVPSQNFMYADVEGHIAVIEPGLFPLRKVKIPSGEEILVVGSRSLLNGTGNYEWIGYIPYSDVPHAIDPDRGFLAAPNQMSIGPYYPYFILGGWWSSGSRAHEIFNDLSSKERFSIEDMKHFQSDIHDWCAETVLPVMIRTVDGKATGLAAEALKILKSWSYEMDKDSPAPLIWWAWFSSLQDHIFKDYLVRNGIKYRFYPSTDTMVWLIKNNRNSKWFLNDFEGVLLSSLNDAVEKIRLLMGSNIQEWKWGDVHKLYLQHLSMIDALSKGPYPEDGGYGVLMNAPLPWDLEILNKSIYVRHGPSLRIVTQMSSNSKELKIFFIYPGGQSGNPIDQHYDDLVVLWINYQYINIVYYNSPEEFNSPYGEIDLVKGG